MYDYAQTFMIDKASVKGSPVVNISEIDLYFRRKPKSGVVGDENSSGITNPGVSISIVETKNGGTPNLSKIIETGYLPYKKIKISGDATQETTFSFNKEVYLYTDKMYAIYIRFDGQEDYVLWTNKKGDYYVDSTVISPGVTNSLVGNFYKTSDRLTADYDPSAGGGSGVNVGVDEKVVWTPINNEDLTFEVRVARYRESGPANSASATETYNLSPLYYDYFLYDGKHSKNFTAPGPGEYVFQLGPLASNNGIAYTVNVNKGNSTITTTTANFSAIFTSLTLPNYIVLVSAGADPNHPSGDTARYSVCDIKSVTDNSIQVGKVPTFTNSVANFIISPVASFDFSAKAKSFSNKTTTDSWYWPKRQREDLLVLKSPNSNLTNRFVNNNIQSITISANGQLYSNTDYVVITSATSGSVNAYANVRTNSSGNITAVYLTNAGAGLISTPSVAIKNSTGGTSSGSGATFSLVEGPWLKSEIKKHVMKDVEVINFEIDAVTPSIKVSEPAGVSYELKHQLAFVKSGSSYIINPDATSNQQEVKNFVKNGLRYTSIPAMMSWSNEVIQRQSVAGNSVHFVATVTSNNDFTGASPLKSQFYYHKYLINNDYTDEHTSFGKALAKHVSKKITFADGRLADDAVVILRAYKPAGTDLKVYAKLYNSQDPEAFDDKDWTLMEITDGGGKTSSMTNTDDVKEFTYGIPQSPNTTIILDGTVSLSSSCTTVTGTGTSFKDELEGVSAGDLVMLYDPLFKDRKYFISSINSVSSATSLVLDDKTSNSSLVAPAGGLKMAKLGYKHQAFRNLNNDNTVRYYNTSMHVYDGYDTMAIKIVMLSSSSTLVPEVEDVRAVGVSA